MWKYIRAFKSFEHHLGKRIKKQIDEMENVDVPEKTPDGMANGEFETFPFETFLILALFVIGVTFIVWLFYKSRKKKQASVRRSIPNDKTVREGNDKGKHEGRNKMGKVKKRNRKYWFTTFIQCAAFAIIVGILPEYFGINIPALRLLAAVVIFFGVIAGVIGILVGIFDFLTGRNKTPESSANRND
jgi:hypothetical protein